MQKWFSFNFLSKSVFITILASFLFLSNNLFAQDNDEGKVINKIIIKGLNKAKKKDVLPLIFSQDGTILDLALVNEDYQRLMGLGYFEDILISTDKAYNEQTKAEMPDMVNLIFETIEKPTIRKTIFRGNKNISYGLLMDGITIKRGDFLDLSKIHSDISAVLEKYHKKGFNYAKVEYEVLQDDELKASNRVDLVFKIEEGIETYVSEISINGNDNISEFTLKNKMKTKERKFLGLQKGLYDEAVFNQDIEDIKKNYRDLGYYLIEVKEPEITYYEIEEKEQKKELIKIKIFITENEQFKFGKIKIEGNRVFPEEDLLYNLKLKEGQFFNYSKYQEALYALQRKYTDSGYIQTEITDKPIIDKENKIIDIEISIKESKRSYIEAIYFKGNDKAKNYVLKRAISTEVGEIFNSAKLMDSIIGLHNLGFFANVEYDIQPGSASGLLKITYIVEEQQTAEVRFGLSIPATQWPPELTLFVEINEKNFLGRQIITSGKAEASLYKQGVDFSVDDPWFLNFPWSLGASLKFYHNWRQKVYRTIYDEDKGDDEDESDIRAEYEEASGGVAYQNKNYLGNENGSFTAMGLHNLSLEISARTGYRFLRYFGVSGSLSCEPIYTWLPPENGSIYDLYYDSDFYAVTYGWSVRNRISSTFSINTTKRKINPYEGIKYSLTAAYTFGHYDSFYLNTSFSAYWKILDVYFGDWPFKNVIAFNSSISMIFPGFRNVWGTDKNGDPISGNLRGIDTAGRGPILYSTDYLTIDGIFSGRGWNNSLVGLGYLSGKRGYAKLDFSLEYRIPLHEQIIWLATFVDMFNLVEGPSKIVYDDDDTRMRDTTNSWAWWASSKETGWHDTYEPLGIDNWYGSIGAGLQITFPQLPLSFYVVKRFKINYFTGFEWQGNYVGGVDFVLSMTGVYF